MSVTKQCQFELFPVNSEHPPKKENPGLFLKTLSFSLENVIILCVVIIISMVVSFSLGVERGKKIPHGFIPKAKLVTSLPPKQIPEVLPATSPTINQKKLKKTESFQDGPEHQENIEKIENLDQISDPKKIVDKIYTVQVASFKKVTYAEKEAMDLKQKGYESIVLPKGKYSIVCVGKFVRKSEAKIFSRRLKKRYKDCLIRSL